MTDTRLYILMRTDLESMNAGKAMAQAAHAANAFTADMDKMIRGEGPSISPNAGAYLNWKGQTSQNFGTTITLAVPSEEVMYDMVAISQALGYPADVIHDPTYPVRDGAVVHLLPIDTCGYVFVRDASNPPMGLDVLPLHP